MSHSFKLSKQTYWILDDKGNPIEEPDLIKWATWCASGGERILRQDKLDNAVCVSTVFLGVNHNWSEYPLLWETMIFGGTKRRISGSLFIPRRSSCRPCPCRCPRQTENSANDPHPNPTTRKRPCDVDDPDDLSCMETDNFPAAQRNGASSTVVNTFHCILQMEAVIGLKYLWQTSKT